MNPEALVNVEKAKAFLPFQLTNGQEKSLGEILEDLRGLSIPMLRLLQGLITFLKDDDERDENQGGGWTRLW